ncbi:MAG: hypothetical protein RBR23_01710 [Arcobacteraceae bacterium]|jgi:hypothetical protein|nr:hypothetical protein [Arcobacteraceae bacterium]
MKYAYLEKDTGKVLAWYSTEIHGIWVEPIYKEEVIQEEVLDENKNIIREKLIENILVKDGYYDLSCIPTPHVMVDDEIWQEAINKNANAYDKVTKTFIIKDFRTVEELKASKTNTINISCKQAIESGFISAALGTEHKYESEEIDQLNLIGAVSSGVSQPIKCSEDGGETWGYKVHTNTQLKTVLKDGAKIKAEYLQKASVLKEQIKNATSLEELEPINW